MTGPWRTAPGSIARLGVMGLVLLSMVLMVCTNAGSAAGAAHASASVSHSGWTPDGLDARLSSLPPAQHVTTRELHALSPWPRGDRDAEAEAHLALPSGTCAEPAAFRNPQQLGHCAAGSRSPPRS
ncbi:hypothetical protein [Nonomuraea coxensis]|nr:hypothetical protein [Nonomuraea coxensis]